MIRAGETGSGRRRRSLPRENVVGQVHLCHVISLTLVSWWAIPPVHGLVVVSSATPPHCLGLDLGTSGARVSVVAVRSPPGSHPEKDPSSSAPEEVYAQAISWSDTAVRDPSYDNPLAWMSAVDSLLQGAREHLGEAVWSSAIRSLAISGTSASCLLVDAQKPSTVTRAPRMYHHHVLYNDSSGSISVHGLRALERLERHVPHRHTARSPTGTLAKLLAWQEEQRLSSQETLCHQADYVAAQFLLDPAPCGAGLRGGTRGVASDWHNCLKLGYDVQRLTWPDWMGPCLEQAGMTAQAVLPASIVSPGQVMGSVGRQARARWGLPPTAVVVGGTTDSNAAFMAAAASSSASSPLGTAVTSLGSTVALKQLSATYVEDATLGVYSHRFPTVFLDEPTLEDHQKAVWLVGGASNVGCAVLRQLQFSNDELDQWSSQLDPQQDSPLSYYPLTKPGERFPVADPAKVPILEPVPENRGEFLHGLLQGISDVERDGYLTLGRLGASPPHPVQIWTSGGGSRNPFWTQLRQRRLRQVLGDSHLLVERAPQVEPSYGAALLAAAHLNR